jgi:TIR domain
MSDSQLAQAGPSPPVRIRAGGPPEQGAVGTVLVGLLFLAAVAGCVSLVIRFRRTQGEERQQLKWFAYAAALIVALLIFGIIYPTRSNLAAGLVIALLLFRWPPGSPSSGIGCMTSTGLAKNEVSCIACSTYDARWRRAFASQKAGAMAGSIPAASGRIFMSYRREETAYPAGWLYDRLADRFGSDQVFKDVDSIELGDDFVEVITRAVGACDVLLALIGREWLTITDTRGRRRLSNPMTSCAWRSRRP